MKFQFTLTVVEGSRKGKSLLFEGPGRLFFGRGDDCFEVLPQSDLTAGRYHALFEIKPPNVYGTDLGSVNGTYLNGKKLVATGTFSIRSLPPTATSASLSHTATESRWARRPLRVAFWLARCARCADWTCPVSQR